MDLYQELRFATLNALFVGALIFICLAEVYVFKQELYRERMNAKETPAQNVQR